MQGSPVQLGPIQLQNFEVPQSLRFGGQYRLAVHRLSSGDRLIERLGPDESDIQFQGTLTGQDAEARAREIDRLRVSGQAIWLTWESFRRRVIVRTFRADYRSPWWINYSIICIVAHAEQVSSLSISSILSADLSYAMAALAATPLQTAQFQAALAVPNAATIGTTAQAGAVAATQAMLTAIKQQVAQQESIIASPALNGTNAADYVTALNAQTESARIVASAIVAKSYVGRISTRLQNQEP